MNVIFDHLMQTGWMPLKDTPPVPRPLLPDPDRLRGMLWGLYLGDALGNPSESQPPLTRRARFGQLHTFLGERGRASDDSQLAFWTLEHLLENERIKPQKLAVRFASEPVSGLGRSLTRFLEGISRGLPWHECSVESLGNGALMRIAPVLLPFLSQPQNLWPSVALAAAMTHRQGGSVAACLAYVELLHGLLEDPDSLSCQRFLATMERCEPDGRLARSTRRAFEEAEARSIPVLEIPSGASLVETLPALLLLLERHGHESEEAVLRAVNDTYDNDTLGALVGAAMGARYGLSAFPRRWLEALEPRVSPGSTPVAELIDRASSRWGGPARRSRPSPWQRVRDRLGSLRLGPPTSFGELHLVPLLGESLELEVELLGRASRVRISELDAVNELQAVNGGPRPVLLLEGEELVGGRQNRMLSNHVLIAPNQTVRLSVSCVERGRWAFNGTRRGFQPSGRLAPATLRSQDQQQVWQGVQTRLRQTRTRSSTEALSAAFDTQESALERLRRELRPLTGQVGMVALLGDSVISLELLASHELYRSAHDKLLAALALEATTRPRRALGEGRRSVAARFLTRLRCVDNPERRGSALRFQTRELRGNALLYRNAPLCLSAFPVQR
ncbi:MAG: hypothetical protein AMXMBFR33_22610 [Candidatus Xenobia bacterium]